MFEVVICLVNTCFVHPYRHGPQAVHGMVAQKEDNQKHPDREKDQDGQQKVISSQVCDATCIGDHAYGSQNPRGQGAHDGCCQIRVEAQCQVQYFAQRPEPQRWLTKTSACSTQADDSKMHDPV